MKNKYGKSAAFIFIIFLLVISPANLYGWGEKGHKIINRKAVDFLPEEMKAFRSWKDYLGDHASDADIRRYTDKTEAPRHFIDIDFYKEFLAGRMIENKDSLISVYGKETVTKIGLLPWATLVTFNNLIKAFKDKNRDRALIYASDLGHYVADGHQPMHTVLNYNGQLTNQKGVHARYESEMINRYYQEIENSFGNCHASLIQKPLGYIFSYITNANSVCVLLFDADNFAAKQAGKTEGEEYYRLMWFRTKYITEVQFNKAAQDLAALIYSAWVDAGKPDFAEFK